MALLAELAAPRQPPTEGHPGVKRAIVADLGGLTDHQAHPVIDKETPADPCAGVDLDAGQHAPEMRQKAPGEPPSAIPYPTRRAMPEQRVKPGIAQHDLDTRPRRRVAGQSGVDFVTQVSQQHLLHYI